MSKLQSLEKLAELGYNTPKLLYRSRDYNSLTQYETENMYFWKEARISPGAKVSIRTEFLGSQGLVRTSCPHYPNITRPTATKHIKKLLKGRFSVYVFEGIDPADCVRRGNLAFFADRVQVEWMEGPGTVRDLEHNPVNSETFPSVTKVIQDDRFKFTSNLILNSFKGQILEWSIYNKPVGTLNREDIYWELRRWQ